MASDEEPLELFTAERMRELEDSETATWLYDYAAHPHPVTWANARGLQLWRAPSLEALRARDFGADTGVATRLYDEHAVDLRSAEGLRMRWTIYPLGEPVSISLKMWAVSLPGGRQAVLTCGTPVDVTDDQTSRLYTSTRYVATLIAMFDTEGTLLVQNGAAAKAHPPVEGREQTFAERFVDPEDHARIRRAFDAGEKFDGEVQVRTAAGDLWFATTVHPARDPGTGGLMVLVHQTNIERVRRAEEALREKNVALAESLERQKEMQTRLVLSEKMATLGNLVAGLAHEINTPVGAILSSVETADRAQDKLRTRLDEGPLETRVAKLLSITQESHRLIQTAGTRVTDLVQRLQAFVRLDAADVEAVDLNHELREVVPLVGHRVGDDVEVVLDLGPLPNVQCHPRQLNQVFVNLVLNGLRSIDERTEQDGEPGTLTIRSSLGDGEVCVEVIDDGVGIEPGMLDELFEPGFTTRGGRVASGLGLAIARSIVSDHGGRLEARSDGLGSGATFRVWLPLAAPAPGD